MSQKKRNPLSDLAHFLRDLQGTVADATSELKDLYARLEVLETAVFGPKDPQDTTKSGENPGVEPSYIH